MEKVPDKTIDQMFHTWSDEDDDRRFGRTTLGPDGHPVGHIIAKDCTAPDHNATMTILIGPYYQNHGYGSLAMKLGIKLAAEQLGAKTITLKAWSFNLRARHMYESLGFKETGRAEHAVERDGHWFDEMVYEAPVSMLLERIAAEESARAEGEKLEEQRLEAERQSDRTTRRWGLSKRKWNRAVPDIESHGSCHDFSPPPASREPLIRGAYCMCLQRTWGVVEIEEDAVRDIADFGPVGIGRIVVHGPHLHTDRLG